MREKKKERKRWFWGKNDDQRALQTAKMQRNYYRGHVLDTDRQKARERFNHCTEMILSAGDQVRAPFTERVTRLFQCLVKFCPAVGEES